MNGSMRTVFVMDEHAVVCSTGMKARNFDLLKLMNEDGQERRHVRRAIDARGRYAHGQ